MEAGFGGGALDCSCGGLSAQSDAVWSMPWHREQIVRLGLSSARGANTVEASSELLTSFHGKAAPPSPLLAKVLVVS